MNAVKTLMALALELALVLLVVATAAAITIGAARGEAAVALAALEVVQGWDLGRLLALASVAGTPLTWWMVRRAARREVEPLVRRVDALERAGQQEGAR